MQLDSDSATRVNKVDNRARDRTAREQTSCTVPRGYRRGYRVCQEIRKIPKFSMVTLSNDLNDDRMLVRKEVYTIFTAAKKIPNVQVNMKGDMIQLMEPTIRGTNFKTYRMD